MSKFRFTVDFISTDEIDIEAKDENEARKKFNEGDWNTSDERNINYTMNEIQSVSEIEQ